MTGWSHDRWCNSSLAEVVRRDSEGLSGQRTALLAGEEPSRLRARPQMACSCARPTSLS